MSLAAMVLADRSERLLRYYDRWIGIITFGRDARVRRAVLAEIGRDERLLDVGCGTGTLAVAAARSGARVVAVDRSAGMLTLARQKADAAGVTIDWRQGDAAVPPVDAEQFDVVTATFVLSELSRDLAAVALRHLADVLRPGGRLIIADEAEPRAPVLRLLAAIPRSLQAVLSFLVLQQLAPTRRHPWRHLLVEAGLDPVSERSDAGGALVVLVARRPDELPRRARPIRPLATVLPTGRRRAVQRVAAWLDLPIAVQPGVYEVGRPGPDGPVLLTGNFLASVEAVDAAMAGRDAYVVVEDTDGWNVWCAGDAGLFDAEKAAALFGLHDLDAVIGDRRVIIPRLGGRIRSRLAALTGWQVEVGPIEARDLPTFLTSGLGPEMRSLARLYGRRERIRVAALTLVQLPLFLLPLRWAPRDVRRSAWAFATLAGCVLPLAHDRLPGRTGIAKASEAGLGVALLGIATRRIGARAAAAVLVTAPLVGWVYQSSSPVIFWKRIWR